jgi:hypothetical protein
MMKRASGGLSVFGKIKARKYGMIGELGEEKGQ